MLLFGLVNKNIPVIHPWSIYFSYPFQIYFSPHNGGHGGQLETAEPGSQLWVGLHVKNAGFLSRIFDVLKCWVLSFEG